MANENKKINNNIFERAAIGAPILAGAGVGIHRLMTRQQAAPFSQRVNAGTNFLGRFASGLSTGPTPFATGEIGAMVGNKDPGMIAMAWDMALQAADPAQIIKREALDPDNPGATIEQFSRTNTSLQGNKVLQNFMGQLRSLETHAEATGMKFSSGMFGKATERKFMRTGIAIHTVEDNILRETLSNIQATVSKIPGVKMNLQMASRQGLEGSQLMVHLKGGKFGKGGLAVELPMEIANQPGVVAHGVTNQTKRIVGRYGIVQNNRIVSTLKHEQFAARRFYEQVLPEIMNNDRLTSSQVRRMVTEFNHDMIEGAQWVPNLPTGQLGAHDAALRLGGARRVLVDSEFNRLNSGQLADVMSIAGNGVFPSTSGNQLAKGVVSTIDAQKFWLGGQHFPWERRPMQAFGRGFGPSSKAMAARASSRVRKQFSWMQTSQFAEIFGSRSNLDVMAKVAYISEKKYPGFADKALGGTLGGAGLRSTILNDQFEHVTPLHENLSHLGPKLKAAMEGNTTGIYDFGKPLDFTEGEIVGWDANRQAVHYTPDMNITGAFDFKNKDISLVRLQGTKTLPAEEYAKVFGGGKVVDRAVNQSELERMIFQGTGFRGVNGAQMAHGMDELRKNRSLHNTQMATALYGYTKQTMRTRQTLTNLLGNSSPDEVVAGMFRLARKKRLGTSAMGRVFGALPDVYGADWQDQLGKFGINFSTAEADEISQGVASGVASFFYGGPPTAGGMGSVEPRLFELLQGGQHGAMGPRMAQELAQRMIMANPETVMEQNILGSALSSISRGARAMEGKGMFNIKNMDDKAIADILQHGGIVDTGGIVDGVKNIYIPGALESASMRGYTTGEGVETTSKLSSVYESFLDIGRQVTHGGAKRAQAQTAMNDLISELGSAHARTITGKGVGLARGKLVGSKYLEAVPGTIEELGDIHTRGIGKKHGLDMFRQMENLYANNPEELAGLAEQKQRFLSGETIGAISARDPDIGPFSVGPAKLRMLKRIGDSPVIVTPQQTKILTDEAGNEISRVSFGSLAGQAGDFDGDNTHIMLTSSKIEKDIHGHYSVGSSFGREYEDYIIRQQLMKAKAPRVEGLTTIQEMTAGAQKLAMAKEAVGPLSVPLREMRTGLIRNQSLAKERYYNALSVLETLEQTPIAGKHIPANRINEMRQQMGRIASAASAGRGRELASITEDIFQHNPAARQLLDQSMNVFVDGEKRTIKGVDLAQVAEDLAQSVSSMKTVNNGMNEHALRGMIKGSRSVTQETIDQYLSYGGGLLSHFKAPAQQGVGAQISRVATAAKNRVTALTGQVLEHAGKPLAIGFGAALAMSAILSKPISNLSPGSSAPPASTGKVASGNSQSVPPENVHPDSHISGEPSSQGMARPTARVQENQSARVHIRGTNRNGANISSISDIISRRLGGNTNVNVSVRDRKSSLSQQRVDALIRR